MGFFGFGWLWDKGNGRIQGAFWVRWKHFVSSWRWVSAKKLPLGVSLWGKSVYTSFCVEQGLTLKGLPSSRDATAFSPLAAASKKRRSSDTLSSRRRFEFQVPRTRNICASVCLGRQAGPLLLVLVQEPWSGLIRRLRTGPLKLHRLDGNGLLVVRQTVCFCIDALKLLLMFRGVFVFGCGERQEKRAACLCMQPT